jgi:predicted LPLAT superfamily acyltransferase
MELILTPHMAADAFYAELLQAHEGLSEAQNALLDAKLVLLLANHVGDLQVLRAVLRAAAQDLRGV